MVSKLLKDLSAEFLDADNEVLVKAEESGNQELLLLVARVFTEIANTLNDASKDAERLESTIDTEGLEQVASFAAEIENNPDLNAYADTLDNLLVVLARENGKEILDLETHIKKSPLEGLYELKRGFEREYKSVYSKFERILKHPELTIESKKRRMGKIEDRLADIEGNLHLIMEAIEKKEQETIGNSAHLATALDLSEDDELIKFASVLDEILLTIGADRNSTKKYKLAEDKEVEKLRAKFREETLLDVYSKAKIEENKQNNSEEAIKAIEDKVKIYRPMEHALSSRQSPDMPGISLMRIGDNVYQCPVTKKIYDYAAGYTTLAGDTIPGTSVTNQTQLSENRSHEHANFSTREEILNSV